MKINKNKIKIHSENYRDQQYEKSGVYPSAREGKRGNLRKIEKIKTYLYSL
jgi:hypothetical protein